MTLGASGSLGASPALGGSLPVMGALSSRRLGRRCACRLKSGMSAKGALEAGIRFWDEASLLRLELGCIRHPKSRD